MMIKKIILTGTLLASINGFAYEKKICAIVCPFGFNPTKECACNPPPREFDEATRTCNLPIRH